MPAAAMVELAKSGRSKCKVCKNKIEKDQLRVGFETTSAWGVQMNWNHVDCFNFSATTDTATITGFDVLSAADQAKITFLLGKGSKKKVPAASPASTAAAGGGAAAAAAPKAKLKKHATQLDEANPNEQGVCKIEYAKPKKPAPCADCRGGIANGEPRVGFSFPSTFYEGLQTRWLHLSCALAGAQGGIQKITQLKGWDRMGYDASLEIRSSTGEILTKGKEKALKNSMEPLEELQDLLAANLSAEQLMSILRLNGYDPDTLLITKSIIDQAVVIADGMTSGVCSDCPCCDNSSLVQCAGRITCWGYLGGTVKCVYKTALENVERFAWKMPASIVAQDWLQDWMTKRSAKQTHSVVAVGEPEQAAAAEKPKKGGKRKVANADEVENTAVPVPHQVKKPMKPTAGGAAKPKRKKTPKREVPMEGSPILEVHAAYEQTGRMAGAKVLAEGSEVYNAMMSDVKINADVNRYYVLQLIQHGKVGGKNTTYEMFRHDGATGNAKEVMLNEYRAGGNENFKAYPSKLPGPAGKAEAIELFKKWFMKKTGNDWEQRHDFKQMPGMYSFVELSTVNKDQINQQMAGKGPTAPCSLAPETASLVELLFDEDTILHSMKEAGVELDEMPLGAVTGETVTAAGSILAQISAHLETAPTAEESEVADAAAAAGGKPTKNKTSKKALEAAQQAQEQAQRVWQSKIDHLSTEFYHKIPSAETPKIDTAEKLSQRVTLVNMLADIALTQKLLRKQKSKKKGGSKKGSKNDAAKAKAAAAAAATTEVEVDLTVEPHVLDQKYSSLGCGLRLLPPSNPLWPTIERYFNASITTHEPGIKTSGHLYGFRHNLGSEPPRIIDIFTMDRAEEAAALEQFAILQKRGGAAAAAGGGGGGAGVPDGNRQLLWHGTNVAVAAAICSSGLRIMPNAGGRLGAGIYLANQAVKSGYYVEPDQNGVGIMFLAEAVLGTPKFINKDSHRWQRLKKGADLKGHDSLIAQGKTEPLGEGERVVLGADGLGIGGGGAGDSSSSSSSSGSGMIVDLTDDQPLSAAVSSSGGGGAAAAAAASASAGGASVLVPSGSVGKDPVQAKLSSFQQTELLVYNEEQVRLRYLVRIQHSR